MDVDGNVTTHPRRLSQLMPEVSKQPIMRLIPHPFNPNVMEAQVRRKLRANIELTGKYPSIIVRGLGASDQFGPGTKWHEEAVKRAVDSEPLQILDGENRWKILKDLGYGEVEVDNWGDVTDQQAEVMLSTLNPLRGRDDKTKRRTLLSAMFERNGAEEMARFLPESVSQIEYAVEIAQVEPLTEEKVEEISGEFEPWSCILDDRMKRVVEAAVKLRMSQGDLPGESLPAHEFGAMMGDSQKGRAVYAICADWILKNGAVDGG